MTPHRSPEDRCEQGGDWIPGVRCRWTAVTVTEAAPTGAPARPDEPRRRAVDRLGVHVGLYVLLLAGLLALTPTLDPWSSDDGAYAHAVRLVADGSWSEDQPELDLQADRSRYALALSEVDDAGRAYPYVKHPAWIAIQRVTTGVLGDRIGFVLPNLAGCVLAAAMAWAASRRIGAGPPALAFWLVALSPVVVTATSLWSHGLAAGFGGVVALLVLRLQARRSPVEAVGLGLALGAVLALRTEGPILVIAAVAALVIARPGRLADLRRLLDPGLAALVAVGVFVAERAWVAALAAGPLTSTGPSPGPSDSLVMGRTLAAWRTLTLGANGDPSGELLTLAALACAGGAVVLVARHADHRRAGALLGAALVLGVIRYAGHVHGQDSLISGILSAWPVMAAGVVLWVRERADAPRAEAALAVLAGGFTVGLLAIQYDGGAGTDWGGRYMTPVIVPLALLAAAGLARARSATTADPRRLLALTVGVGLVLTAFGTHVTGTMRSDSAAVVARARAADVDVVVSGPAFVPRTDLADDATTFWRRPGEEGPARAVERAFAAGHRRVGVLGAEGTDLDVPDADREVVVEDELTVYERREG
jgi:hypothetical protein